MFPEGSQGRLIQLKWLFVPSTTGPPQRSQSIQTGFPVNLMASHTTSHLSHSDARRLSFGLSSEESDDGNSDGVRLSLSVSSIQESDGNVSEPQSQHSQSSPPQASAVVNSSSGGNDQNTQPDIGVVSLTPPSPSEQQAAALSPVPTDGESVPSSGTPTSSPLSDVHRGVRYVLPRPTATITPLSRTKSLSTYHLVT